MLRCCLIAGLVVATGCGDKAGSKPAVGHSRLARRADPAPAQNVSVSGTVIDRDTRDPAGDVEVVLRGEHGDVTTHAKADGTFAVVVPRGSYRTFVRDARVMSTGLERRVRVRSLPRAELAGVADEQLMPVLVIDDDTTNIELLVVASAVIDGTVTDPDGKPVADVVVQAVPPIPPRGARRPVLGTDTVITDATGRFVLRVPGGQYQLVADHAKFAGFAPLEGSGEFEVAAGARLDTTLTLTRGCIISGKVIGAGGTRAHDGALEVRRGYGSWEPTGRVAADGTFKWTTRDDEHVQLKAWPWQSPPSPAQTFECRDGKHFDNVVLRAGNELPDLAGTIVDAQGDPVPLAFLDIAPLDGGTNSQQERANAAGAFEVFEMPPGRYEIQATAAGRGVISTMVVGPRTDISLQLSGAGRLSGTTTELVDGTFELVLHQCGATPRPQELDEDTRLVVVRGGRFSVDQVPACAVTFSAQWRDRVVTGSAVVEPGKTAYVELDLGKARDKIVRGTVRDRAGKPVANARVTALVDNQESATVRTGDDGAFELKTQSGAELLAGNGRKVGRGTVGRANVGSERVDLVLDSIDY
jgi:hypothetical protein